MPLVRSLSVAVLGAACGVALLAGPGDASAPRHAAAHTAARAKPALVDVGSPQNLPTGGPPRAAYLDFRGRSPIFRPGEPSLDVGTGRPRSLMRVHGGFLVTIGSSTVRFVGDDGERRRMDHVDSPEFVDDAVASGDGRLVAITTHHGNGRHEHLTVRRVSDGRQIAQRSFTTPVNVAALSEHRALLTPGSVCGGCGLAATRWWDLRNGRLKTIDDTARATMSSNGIWPAGDLSTHQVALVSGDHERVVTLPRRPSTTWRTHTDEWVLSWSPDHRYVMTVRDWSEGGWDSLTVRRADSGAVVTRFKGNGNLAVNGLWTPVWEDASTIVFLAGYDCMRWRLLRRHRGALPGCRAVSPGEAARRSAAERTSPSRRLTAPVAALTRLHTARRSGARRHRTEVALQLVCIGPAEGVAVCRDPLRQDDLPGGGGIGVRQTVGHREVLLAGEQRVPQTQAQRPGDDGEDHAGHRQDPGVTADAGTDVPQEIGEGEGLRTDRVDRRVGVLLAEVGQQGGEVVDVDAADPVAAVAAQEGQRVNGASATRCC